VKDFDQETWVPTKAAITNAVIDAYARLSEETRVPTIMAWTELACLSFPKDRDAAGRYLIWLLRHEEEGA
jgi:hypothetical protein